MNSYGIPIVSNCHLRVHSEISLTIGFSIKVDKNLLDVAFLSNELNKYRIAENIGGRKHWRIQLFRLFRVENFGEWPITVNIFSS